MGAIQLTGENFEEHTKSGVALLDFWAPWCGPCRALTPVMDQLAGEFDDVAIAKVNCDEEKELAARFEVRSIPALFILKDGEVVKNFIGVQTKQILADAITAAQNG